jgi:hypothetical protein
MYLGGSSSIGHPWRPVDKFSQRYDRSNCFACHGRCLVERKDCAIQKDLRVIMKLMGIRGEEGDA